MDSADEVKVFGNSLFQDLLEQARNTARKRINFNFHPDLGDNPHRFLNVMLQGTYITPHRHLNPPKSESFLVLEGEAAFFIFNDDGAVKESHTLTRATGEINPGKENMMGIDIAPGIWHTLVVLSPYVICYEVKPGPYVETADKEFAPWAPVENTEDDKECRRYLETLLAAHRSPEFLSSRNIET